MEKTSCFSPRMDGLKRSASFLYLAFALGSLSAADFAPGDKVVLTKDAQLYFAKTTALRMGKRGEQFTVIAARPDEHRVYVSALNAVGTPIALNVADDAVMLVKEQPGGTDMRQGVNTAEPAKFPVTMAARMSEPLRTRAMLTGGGRKESEAAVIKGLRWLVDHQSADGSWGPENKGAMTGFALLCFLGHGETPASQDYGTVVQKGIGWLLDNGKKNDGRLSMSANFSAPGVYEHAIATYALGEYYAMTKDERAADLLKKAIGYIVEGQGPDGGWMYAYDKTKGDTSVSGWQIQALKAAHLGGLKIEGVDAALDKAMLNLKRVQAEDGSFGYRDPRPGSSSLTGAGVYCTYVWKGKPDKSSSDGMNFIVKQTSKEHPVDYHHEKADLYSWYYNTHACFVFGGGAWAFWNSRLPDQLVKNQSPDGSWPPTAGKSPGGELQRDAAKSGPFFRTTLCILMLEVYYRYLPERLGFHE